MGPSGHPYGPFPPTTPLHLQAPPLPPSIGCPFPPLSSLVRKPPVEAPLLPPTHRLPAAYLQAAAAGLLPGAGYLAGLGALRELAPHYRPPLLAPPPPYAPAFHQLLAGLSSSAAAGSPSRTPKAEALDYASLLQGLQQTAPPPAAAVPSGPLSGSPPGVPRAGSPPPAGAEQERRATSIAELRLRAREHELRLEMLRKQGDVIT